MPIPLGLWLHKEVRRSTGHISLFPRFFLYHFRFLFVWTIEYVVRSILPDGVFLPCDHGLLGFLTSAYYVRIQSINQSCMDEEYENKVKNRDFSQKKKKKKKARPVEND